MYYYDYYFEEEERVVFLGDFGDEEVYREGKVFFV